MTEAHPDQSAIATRSSVVPGDIYTLAALAEYSRHLVVAELSTLEFGDLWRCKCRVVNLF
jgi:hypothetical protein